MSEMKTLTCKTCGGPMSVYSFGRFAKCPYCGTQNILEKKNPSWAEGNYTFTRVCPVCRENGSLVLNKRQTKWQCLNCGYNISPQRLEEEVFWFCDSCDAFLNVQPGFSEEAGRWKCKHCGYENDVSEDNVFD